MSRQVQIGQVVTDQFPIFETDGYTKRSGEAGSCTATLWHNGVVDAASVTITEIGSTGEYRVQFTPDKFGFWLLEVAISYSGSIVEEGYDVGNDQAEAQLNVAYEEGGNTLSMDVWLDRDGSSVPAADLSGCTVAIYDIAGTEILSVIGSGAAEPDGRYKFQ